jgi:DNA-binding CsgD family transcriptional regulator
MRPKSVLDSAQTICSNDAMSSLSLLLFLAALAAGLTAMGVSFVLFKGTTSGFTLAFTANLLFFNLLIIVGLIFNMSGWSLGKGPEIFQFQDLRNTVLFGMTLLKFAWLYAFLEMTGRLIRRPPSRAFRLAYVSVCLTLLVLLLLAFTYLLGPLSRSITAFLVVFIESLILAGALMSLIALIIRTYYAPDVTNKRAVYVFASIYITLFCILVGSLILSLFMELESGGSFIEVNTANMIAYNILPLVWLRRYARKVGREAVIGGGDPEELFSRLQITPREQDIIRLICEGRSNKEIASELYIAVKTVKDHNSRIFRKVGVRSRAELMRVFRALIPGG